MMLKNFRLIAAQSSPVSPLGQLDYREGWFAIIPKEGQPTLCGIQVHLNDKSLAEFPNRDWPAIEHWAEKGLLKPDAAPICRLLLNWKFPSVVLPSKSNSKHFNLTRYQTAGHATWKVGGQHTMDNWTCHLRHCANISCRTNSRRTLSKATPTAICFNGMPTFGIHGLKWKDKISKKIGTRKAILTIPNDRRQFLRRMTSNSYSETRRPTTS